MVYLTYHKDSSKMAITSEDISAIDNALSDPCAVDLLNMLIGSRKPRKTPKRDEYSIKMHLILDWGEFKKIIYEINQELLPNSYIKQYIDEYWNSPDRVENLRESFSPGNVFYKLLSLLAKYPSSFRSVSVPYDNYDEFILNMLQDKDNFRRLFGAVLALMTIPDLYNMMQVNLVDKHDEFVIVDEHDEFDIVDEYDEFEIVDEYDDEYPSELTRGNYINYDNVVKALCNFFDNRIVWA